MWQDTSGKTWLSYVDPANLAKRYGLPAETATAVGNLTGALRALTAKAAPALRSTLEPLLALQRVRRLGGPLAQLDSYRNGAVSAP